MTNPDVYIDSYGYLILFGLFETALIIDEHPLDLDHAPNVRFLHRVRSFNITYYKNKVFMFQESKW